MPANVKSIVPRVIATSIAEKFLEMADAVEEFDPSHAHTEGVALGLRMAAYELVPELRPTGAYAIYT
jgi:hypothetical protein